MLRTHLPCHLPEEKRDSSSQEIMVVWNVIIFGKVFGECGGGSGGIMQPRLVAIRSGWLVGMKTPSWFIHCFFGSHIRFSRSYHSEAPPGEKTNHACSQKMLVFTWRLLAVYEHGPPAPRRGSRTHILDYHVVRSWKPMTPISASDCSDSEILPYLSFFIFI